MTSRTAYIPLFAPNLGGRTFTLDRGNPGVGGSQFTTIQFAMLLARARPDWHVVIGNNEPLSLQHSPPNLQQRHAPDLDGFYDALGDSIPGIVISMSIHLWRRDPRRVLDAPGVPVIWSRHPFDGSLRLREMRRRPIDVVCVGEYQWHSNLVRGQRTHFIEELYIPPAGTPLNPPDSPSREPRAVHVSSLVRAKGFLEVAKAWPGLRRAVPGIRLEVIGGTSLYGDSAGGRLVPTDPDFEREILRHIPEQDIRDGLVTFHGTMGVEKFDVLSRCDFAILNPTGASEAFPATPLECMGAGLPVIASDDFGMADCMRHFPELAIRNPADIASRARWLVSDATRYRGLRDRSVATASRFAQRAEHNLSRWIALLDALADGNRPAPNLRPSGSLHDPRRLMMYRRNIQPLVLAAGRRIRRLVGR